MDGERNLAKEGGAAKRGGVDRTMRIRIVNHARRWAAPEVPRCGCTTLKTLTYRDNFPADVTGFEPMDVHRFFGYTREDSGGFVVSMDNPVPEGYLRFAVWRDPVERMASLWRRFCSGPNPHEHPWAGVPSLTGCSWDTFAGYVRWMNRSPPVVRRVIDHHIAPQASLYGPEDVNFVVRLGDLDRFLGERLGYWPWPKLNGSDREAVAVDGRLLGGVFDGDHAILDWGKTWQPDS